ncbi:MAG: dihydrolipoyllysine-residue acetyltransferase [Burkholderia sp.]|nr:dihydrolipoyllysine-residue acetyltransferase [Burkholderia sp.]
MSQSIEVKVPNIGVYKDVPVIDILVKVGDTVDIEQSLVTLESDKATIDVPSPASGIVKDVSTKLGELVSEGSLIALLETDSSTLLASSSSVVTTTTDSSTQTASAVSDTSNNMRDSEHYSSHASPSVRKLARELGVDVLHIHGTGPKGRITKDDVTKFSKCNNSSLVDAATSINEELNLLPWPNTDFSKFGSFELKPLSRIKKISGANLHRNWVMIPHITNNDNVDITDIEELRVQLNEEYTKEGIKFTVLAFIIKAVTSALKKFPMFNASLDKDNIILKNYYHIGFAVDTPNGLTVPVIWDANKKGLIDIAKEISKLASAAREGKLKLNQMQGGCFSISSIGGIGGAHFTPIINAPEVAILGISRSIMKPIWDGKQFVPRLIMPLSLSYDHRVIDGAEAARFNAYLVETLSDFRRVSL